MDAGSSFAADAAIYDRSRRQLIPCFDDFYAAALRQSPFDAGSEIDVLDLGAGTGLLTSFFAEAHPGATFTLVDVAGEMLERARDRLGADTRYTYAVADIAGYRPARQFDLVISALAIHHLDGAAKRSLFARTFDALRPGGVFVNADQMLAPTPALQYRYERQWIADAHALGVSDADLAAAQERMTHDRCDTLADQLAWLRAAGFADVDCVYKHGFFAVMRGAK